MALTPRAIECKPCAKTLATVSSTGLVHNPSATDTEGCDVCRRFDLLYNAMQAADEDYALFKDRRDTYGPKKEAFAALRQRRVEFHNWLMHTEEVHEELQPGLSDSNLEPKDEQTEPSSSPHGIKRSRSQSQSPTRDARLRTSSPKTKQSTKLLPEHRRIKFSDSVQFREDYRPSQYYSRSEETYVRGRYAPIEGSKHLDTSGCSKTALQFMGTKKIGQKWVDVWTGDSDDDKKKSKAKVKRTTDVLSADADTADMLATSHNENVADAGLARTDARADRLARRAISTTARHSRRRIQVKSRSEELKGQQLSKQNDVPDLPSQLAGSFSHVTRNAVGAGSDVLKLNMEVRTEAKCVPSGQAKNESMSEEAQPYKYFVGHDHVTPRYTFTKGDNGSTEEAHNNDEYSAGEKTNTTGTDQKYDSIDGAKDATSEPLRRARANSQEERGLAVRAFSTTAAVADRQQMSIDKGVLQVSMFDHEKDLDYGLPHDQGDAVDAAADRGPQVITIDL
jgi:hypothetical protein